LHQVGLTNHFLLSPIAISQVMHLKGILYKIERTELQHSVSVYRWMHKKTTFVAISRVIVAKIGQERNKRSGCSKHK